MAFRLETEGHREFAALADVVRTFFASVERRGDSVLTAACDQPICLLSSVDPPVSPQQARAASRSGRSDRLVRVTSGPCRREGGLEAGGVTEEVPLHDLRRVLKRQLHLLLEGALGLSFPWGSLTGVRPTRIALEAIRKKGRAEAEKELLDYWRLSPAKARLAAETALAEEAILSSLEEGQGLLYVGLPFCPSRCLYCSFITQDAKRQAGSLEAYVEAVIREARGVFSDGGQGPLAAVYYGGGTPTSLPAPLFERFLQGVLEKAPLAAGAEMTMEAGRPDTLDREKLDLIRKYGFHRLCVNPQTMQEATLKRIGRRHTVEETVRAFRLARSLGFGDINMDLIAGLPGEGAAELLDSLEQVMALGPEHITLHTLAVKRGSALDRLPVDRQVFLPDQALIEAVEEAQESLRRQGYRPYYLYRQKNCLSGLENTGFTRTGGSLYNVAMMSDQVPVIGLGSGSTSKVILEATARRHHNPKDLLLYIDRVEELIRKKKTLFSL